MQKFRKFTGNPTILQIIRNVWKIEKKPLKSPMLLAIIL